MNEHEQHILKHMIYCNDLNDFELSKIDFTHFAFDTESCTDNENDDSSARVYAWSLGWLNTEFNKNGDYQIYGNSLEQFIDTLIKIGDYHYKYVYDGKSPKGKKKEIVIKLPIGVHNLSWDVEFLKYFFEDKQGYKYNMGEIKHIYKPTPYETINVDLNINEYNIVDNDGIVYGAEFCFLEKNCKTKRGKEYKIKYVADMWDTLKVMSRSIDEIDEYCNYINPMFSKLKEEYNYELWRSPNHILSTFEKRYLYNDVYRLCRALEQFYIPICLDNGLDYLNKRTASSIAFEILKIESFSTSSDKNYNDVYNKYYDIGKSCGFDELRDRLDSFSYQGGYTHINKDVINKTITKYDRGVDGFSSWDINSSYPSQMLNKPLPYGNPIYYTVGFIPSEVDNVNKVALIEIGFDFCKPKKKEYDLPIFKIGMSNIKNMRPIVGDYVTGNEYFSTNIGDDYIPIDISRDVGSEHLEHSSYNMVVTSAEYEFLINHYDFGYYKPKKKENNYFNGLEIGVVMVYKAESGILSRFINKFAKMKIIFKGLTSEEFNSLLKREGVEYFDGLLTPKEIENCKIKGLEKNLSKVTFAKLCLNSSYGKFGTKKKRHSRNMITDKHGIKRFATESDEECERIDYNSKEYHMATASFITSYGRLQIWNTILALGVENFAYTDTDSVYTFIPKDEAIVRLEKGGQSVHKTTLGAYDNEHNFSIFHGLGQKKYALLDGDSIEINDDSDILLKCCGLPSEARKELVTKIKDKKSFKPFSLGEEVTGKKQRIRVIGGAILKDIKYKINVNTF